MSEVKVNKISPRTNCGTTQLGDAGDTITVTGDLKSNSLKSASGSTITLGQSGDTIQLGCGASQTGFGRTGTVDWDTTAKTASFTAVSGNGYFVNTTSGAITVTLPAGSAGDIVGISDYASTFQTNNVTITPNGTDKINGVNDNATLSTQGLAVSLVYVDATRGWKSVTGSDNDTTGVLPAFVVATGGTVTCCGDYKIHTFTSPGTFTVTCAGNPAGSDSVDYLVVAGGGGGYGSSPDSNHGGGGGAGGARMSSGTASGCYTASPLGSCVSALPITATGYPITVGGGGSGPCAANGSNSVFSTITSTGGGSGNANTGGSGGGGRSTGSQTGGSGNTPPVSPPQGNPGGNGNYAPNNGYAGGGGGAGGAGTNNTSCSPEGGGSGGIAINNDIASPGTYYAGGGAGGGRGFGGTGGTGGNPLVPVPQRGGGGPAGNDSNPGNAGTANTGGGGGGSGNRPTCGSGNGGNGGSGIIIIRYKYQ
jgi:hypothetical protein